MALKSELVQMKLTKADHEHVKAMAKEHDVTITEYMHDSMKFYGDFDHDFLSIININAQKTGLSIPDIIQRFIMASVAIDAAALKVFGRLIMHNRALQIDESGNSITGPALNEKVFKEAVKSMESFKQRLIASTVEGKPLLVEDSMAAILSQVVSKSFFDGQKEAVLS